MKRIIALLLILIMTLSLCACGGGDVKTYQLGDTVSTDIADFTLKKASLGFYANGEVWYFNADTNTTTLKNVDTAYEPSNDPSSVYAASKGHTLVCLDFEIKNNDRNSLNIGGWFGSEIVKFEIKQGKNPVSMRYYDLNNKDGAEELDFSLHGGTPIAKNGGSFEWNTSSNIIIFAGSTAEAKIIGVAGFESEDLTAPFEITVNLADSEGNFHEFIYSI